MPPPQPKSHANLSNEQSMREDLFKAKTIAEANLNLRKIGAWDKLSAEQKRHIEKMLLGLFDT